MTYKFPTATENKVARTFAPPNVKWSAGHRGVDISLEAGSEVLAAGDGVVIYAGKLNDRSLISIEHADGIRTTYEPVSPSVTKGDKVSAGQVIGTLDEGHCGPKSCLHWGAKHGKDNYIDPLSLLRNRQIRLIE
ncbi:MAG: M23 family metallopeptidase [Actinomycetaceae bacterium]|nr:M23 family metallopeptidase [Actinomycetaceae bacterium]